MVDLYAVLRLAPDAEPEDIKQAFRALVKEVHPDHHPDDPDAHERFLHLKEAYETLSDPDLRAEYDLEFVEAFPGYELEMEEEDEYEVYYDENPPARMPVDHSQESNGQIKLMMVLILPILSAALAAMASGLVWVTCIAAAAGIGLAIWLGTLLDANT